MRKKEKITTNLAGLLKKYRKKANLKQQAAADILHMTRQTLSDYERGKAEVPVSSLMSLVSLYDIPLSELLFSLCENDKQTDYVNKNYPNSNDPILNTLIRYFGKIRISPEEADFLYENDNDGQTLKTALIIQKTYNKKNGK